MNSKITQQITLDLTHPVKLTGCFDDTMVSFVTFILSTKFQLKRPLSMEFKPTKTCQGSLGEYRSADAGYRITEAEVVIVCTKHEHKEVLRTIAHELRHVEQNHYEWYPTQKQLIQDYLDSFNTPGKFSSIEGKRKKDVQRRKEKDARDYELITINEFIAAQQQITTLSTDTNI